MSNKFKSVKIVNKMQFVCQILLLKNCCPSVEQSQGHNGITTMYWFTLKLLENIFKRIEITIN